MNEHLVRAKVLLEMIEDLQEQVFNALAHAARAGGQRISVTMNDHFDQLERATHGLLKELAEPT